LQWPVNNKTYDLCNECFSKGQKLIEKYEKESKDLIIKYEQLFMNRGE